MNPTHTPPARLCACGNGFVPTEAQIRWRRYKCADCVSTANRRFHPPGGKRKATDAEWQKEYQGRPEVLARRNELLAKYRSDPERARKIRARDLLRSAVRWGRIERQPCEVCGMKAEGHHHDYSKPYDVRWLCRKHHNETHHPKSI